MGLILHLTDLHLGKAADRQDYGDYKSKVVAPGQRTQRRTLLENTLKEIAVNYGDEGELDAVVVSGDLTVRNDEEGFRLFGSVLAKLGPLLPPTDRIVVVPGNHDVAWGTPASSRARYRLFLEYVRKAGYVTPFIDGRDIDDDGNHRGKTQPHHHVIAADGRLAIFALNSSNWCGSLEPVAPLSQATWDKLASIGSSPATKKKIGEKLSSLRMQDVARFSDAQLRAMQQLMRDVDQEAKGSGRSEPVRIVVLHHQLLPVSTFEEFKPFETITNLGLLRNFLRSMKISVALHGHKHHGFIYKDHVYSPDAGLDQPAHEVVVFAGSTVGGTDFQKTSICQLLRIDSSKGTEGVTVTSLPAVSSGGDLAATTWRRYSLVQPRLPEDGGPHLIDADTASEAYARLKALCASGPQRNVLCQVRDPESAGQLPDGYPSVTGESGEEPQAWFEDIVGWWQRPDSKLARLRFRHGHRIYAYDDGTPKAYNQVRAAARALAVRRESSRAVIVLVDPRTDKLEEETRKFPSFCIAHLVLRERDDGNYLDCTGYFRKQEVAYWWPVNLGELRHLQREAIGHMGDVPKLKAGSLTTVAATAHVGTSKPAVAVPLVDRHYDEHPEKLWEVVYSIVAEDVGAKGPVVERWNTYLSDLTPSEKPDRDGVPVALEGVNYLREEAKKFATHHEASILRNLSEHLEDLLGHNREYAARLDESPDDVDPDDYAAWRREVEKVVKRIEEQLNVLVAEEMIPAG